MKKIYFFLVVTLSIGNAISQCYWCPPGPINPADTALISSPSRREWFLQKINSPIVVDGIKDNAWNIITSKKFDRYIQGRTTLENGIYSLTDEFRLPKNDTDFSGSYQISFDDDYIYNLFDVTDDEVNDGVINAGKSEMVGLFFAPYPDSATQILNGKTYPSCNNLYYYIPEYKKFLYWNHLGAYSFYMLLQDSGKCKIHLNPTVDAVGTTEYYQKTSSCQCAWKKKDDHTGYVLETAISLKIALTDSNNNPMVLPTMPDSKKSMAFDLILDDVDAGYLKPVRASWNAKDLNVGLAMLYTGKLSLACWCIGNKEIQDEEPEFYPNPSTNVIKFKNTISSIQIISITGTVMCSAINTTEINVVDLPAGIYAVMANGKPVGKLIKE